MKRSDRGQSAVELALVLPLLALVLLGIVSVGQLASTYIMVTHAAREGARAAAVDPDPGAAEDAVEATGLREGSHLRVETRNRGRPGSHVTVTVRYRFADPIPLLHRFVGVVDLTGEATMRVER